MFSFLNKIIVSGFIKHRFNAKIISDVKFSLHNSPIFLVKMRGCKTPVDIEAEDIIDRFINNFDSSDIKIATIAYMKYRSLQKLVSIERNYAILSNNEDHSYQLVDLADARALRNINFEIIKSEDSFKLGMHFERLRQEKQTKTLNLVKSENNTVKFRLVKSNE